MKMSGKPYRLGILIGRFQTPHLGHEQMIEKALELCEEVGVFIGSSQESGTVKNPYPYEVREALLREVFQDRIKIYPLPDIGVGNNSSWGDYVIENVVDRFGCMPDILISGKEERRLSWFDSVKGLSLAELYIPKAIDISASEMRNHMIEGNFEIWKQYTNPVHWDNYENLRKMVLESKDNLESQSL